MNNEFCWKWTCQGGTAQKKEEQKMTSLELFVTEGNEVEEMANDGAMLGGGEMAQIRASAVQQRREEVYAALQNAACSHRMVEKWHDYEVLTPRPKERTVDGRGRKKELLRNIARSGARPRADIVCEMAGRSSNRMRPWSSSSPNWKYWKTRT